MATSTTTTQPRTEGRYETDSIQGHDKLTGKAGRIVNITSVGGKVSVPHLLPSRARSLPPQVFPRGYARKGRVTASA